MAEIQLLIGQKWNVIDDISFIEIVDIMGNEQRICNSARISHATDAYSSNVIKNTNKKTMKKSDINLLRFLIEHSHTSPLEMCKITLHIKCPIFVARHIMRHRTANMNELSARYTELTDEFYVPDIIYGKYGDQQNAQLPNSTELAEKMRLCSTHSYDEYKQLIESGVNKEIARTILPANVYTRLYWTMDLHNLLHFCQLRSSPRAQIETKKYSDIILHKIIATWCPNVYDAFMNYRMNAFTVSPTDLHAFNHIKYCTDDTDLADQYTKAELNTIFEKSKILFNNT